MSCLAITASLLLWNEVAFNQPYLSTYYQPPPLLLHDTRFLTTPRVDPAPDSVELPAPPPPSPPALVSLPPPPTTITTGTPTDRPEKDIQTNLIEEEEQQQHVPGFVIGECLPSNDLEQLERFWSLWREGKTGYTPFKPNTPLEAHNRVDSEGFSYKVKDDSPDGGPQRLFTIQEYRNGEPYRLGGSNFRGEIMGQAGALLCSTIDHFDGTYSMCCPPAVRYLPQEACSNLTISLMFTQYYNWQASGQLLPLLQVIHHELWCPPLQQDMDTPIQSQLVPPGPLPTCKDYSDYAGRPSNWRRVGMDDRELRWVTGTGDKACVHERFTNDTTRQCLRDKLTSLRIFGDSHLRTLSHQYSRMYDPSFVGEWGHFHTQIDTNFFFYWIGQGWEVNPCMTDATIVPVRDGVFKGVIGGSDVMVMNNGAWDLWLGGVSNYLNATVPEILGTIRQLREDPVWSQARLIYVTNFPYPMHSTNMGFRSDYSSHAVDQYIVPKLLEMGVEVFDVLPITNARSRDAVDDHHWLDELGRGEVGHEFASLLLHLICN